MESKIKLNTPSPSVSVPSVTSEGPQKQVNELTTPEAIPNVRRDKTRVTLQGPLQDGHGPPHHHRERVFSMRARRQTDHEYSYDDWGNVVDDAEVGIMKEEDVVELMMNSQRILTIFLLAIGRYPLKTKRGLPNSPHPHHFEFSWKSVQGILFVVTSFIIFFVFVMGVMNLYLVGYGYGEPSQNKTVEDMTPLKIIQVREKGVWKRGYLLFIASAVNVFNSLICTGILIQRRHQFANYFELWASSLQSSQLDVSQRTWVNSTAAVGVTCLLAVFVIFGTLVKLATMVNGSLVTAMMTFRLLSPSMLLPDSENRFSAVFYVLQTIGVLLTFFLYLWSRSLIVLYYVKIKELVNGIGMWNGRVYSAVLQKEHPQTKERRTTYLLLFKDHCTLLDLMDATNSLFEWILECFFASHALIFVFEVIFFFFVMRLGHRLDRASQAHTDDQRFEVSHGRFFTRPYDLFSVIVMFFLDQIFYFMVIVTSSDVAEEMIGGLEIARRSSLIGRKTDEELFFLLSLYNSFNRFRPPQMEGAGFFTINKQVFVSLMVVVVFAVVIGLMFNPIFDWPKDRDIVGPFVSALEGLPDCHWRVNLENWTTCNI